MFDEMQTRVFSPSFYTMLSPSLRWCVQSADCAKGRMGAVSVSKETGRVILC